MCLDGGHSNGVGLRSLPVGSVVRVARRLGRYRLLLLLCVLFLDIWRDIPVWPLVVSCVD